MLPKLAADIFGELTIIVEDSVLIEAPEPVLFNTWKHHAGVLKQRIREAIAEGDAALAPLARRMVVIGSELMDLYVGALAPGDIAEQVLDELRDNCRLDWALYRDWLKSCGGYAMLPLADGSEWVLRCGDETGRYVHVHPGRWTPHTCRVRANVLKTAVIALAHAGIHGGDPLDLSVVNAIRKQYLSLAPIGRDLSGDQGIGSIIDLLK